MVLLGNLVGKVLEACGVGVAAAARRTLCLTFWRPDVICQLTTGKPRTSLIPPSLAVVSSLLRYESLCLIAPQLSSHVKILLDPGLNLPSPEPELTTDS